MKWTLLILIFVLAGCAQLTRYPAAEAEFRHVVFDIDWTIVAEIKPETQKTMKSKRVVEVAGHSYFVNEGLESFIQDILDKKDVKISFYSGGQRARNLELLSKIKLRDGRSLKDVSYKILSFEDLATTDAAADAPFFERFKKDLSKVTPDLDQLIMFDDTYDFVLNTKADQTNHVFFIGSAFEHFESFKDTKELSGKYIPKTESEWMLNNKKLYILNAAFNDAYLESNSGNVPFSEAMKRKEDQLNLKGHQWNELSEHYYKNAVQIDFPKKIQETFRCNEAMKVLIGP